MSYGKLQYQRNFVIIIDALLLIFGAVGLLQMRNKADLPFQLKSSVSGLVTVAPIALSSSSGIPQDALIKIVDGKPVSTHEDLEFVCDGMIPGAIISVTYSHRDVPNTVMVRLVHFYSTVYVINAGLVGAVFFFIGLFVLLKRPKGEEAALTFHHVMVAVYILVLMTWGSYIYPNRFSGEVVRFIFAGAYAFFPVFFIRFPFVFPRAKWQGGKRILPFLFVISFILWTGMNYTFHRAVSENSASWFDTYEAWFDPTRAYFSLACLFTLGNFMHSFKYSLEESERRKLRWILLGTAAGALSFVFLWQLPQLVTSEALVPEQYIITLILIVPLTYGFSILRYHAFNIDLIFRRSTVYFLVLLSLASIYAIIIGGFTVIVGRLTVTNSVFLSGAAAVLSALLMQPLRNFAQRFVDRKFFMVQFSFREALTRISEKIESSVDIDHMIYCMLTEIDSCIPLTHLLFKHVPVEVAAGHWKPPSLITLSDGSRDIQLTTIAFTAFNDSLPRIAENAVEKGVTFVVLSDNFRQLGFSAVFPVFSTKTGLKGIILAGAKKSEFVFSVEEISLITSACAQTAAAIDRIELQHRLLIEQESSARLKELNELKSFFVSSVSHDLKTPLTSIRMFSEILQAGQQPQEKQIEYLRIIEGESERLTRLINNILDFAKIEQGVKQYLPAAVSLNELVRETVRILSYQFKIGGFSLAENYAPEPCRINADSDAVIEAVMNLLSNAMKYSAQSKKIIIKTEQTQCDVRVQVKDEGIGIPSEQLNKVFEPFQRVNNEQTRHAGGTGLGLTIVRHIMEAHNGKVEIESELGKGSSFSLLFPLYDQVS